MATTMTSAAPRARAQKVAKGSVYCLICTRIVEAEVVLDGRKVFVKAGQKCPRCATSLDPAAILEVGQAA